MWKGTKYIQNVKKFSWKNIVTYWVKLSYLMDEYFQLSRDRQIIIVDQRSTTMI